MDVIYLDNDHVIDLDGLQDADGAFVSDAAVTATLYLSDGETEVGGVVWPLTLTYRGSRGDYRGQLPASVDLVCGNRYKMRVVADSVGRRFSVMRTVIAEERYG